MFQNGEYQLDLTRRLAFNRLGGTDDELRAACILQSEIGDAAGFEEFEIPGYVVQKARLRVLEPFTREIPVTGVGFSGSTPEAGLTAPFAYAQEGSETDLTDVRGKIILLNSNPREIWKKVLDSGAAGFLIISGAYNDEDERTDLERTYLRDYMLRDGRIPGLTLRTRDAIELVRGGATLVNMELTQNEHMLTSRNVVAEIPGTDKADEIIVFTAHYDSVPFSCGAWDNASGSADLMALYLWFRENPPRRTLRFIWCGSEERGLLGSIAYVKAHMDEISRFRFGINIDMTGPVIGHDRAIVTSDIGLQTMLEYFARERGHSLSVSQAPYSSDSTPFSDAGVPTVSFHRAGQAAGHSRYDLPEPLGSAAFAKTWNFIREFAEKTVNSAVVPVPREIPQNMKDEIDKYFHRTPNPPKP